MKKLTSQVLLSTVTAVFLAAACTPGTGTDDAGTDAGEGEGECAPGSWSAPSFATNAADALALRAAIDGLTGDALMRGAETSSVTVDDLADLTGPYAAGTPSLSSVTTTGFDAITQDAFEEFVELINVGPLDLVDGGAWTPGTHGGLFGSSPRGINEGGIEVRQIVDKGLFAGGAMYSYALGLTEGTITEARVESIVAAWGASETLTSDVVTDSANYSQQQGYFADMAAAATEAHTLAEDSACVAERDAALVTFFRLWEESMFSRFAHYAYAASVELTAAADDDAIAGGIHELSEGLGLALGFHGLSSPSAGPLSGAGRVVTDAQIEAMVEALGVDPADLGASTTGELAVDPTSYDTGLATTETELKAAFDIDDAELDTWQTPTAG